MLSGNDRLKAQQAALAEAQAKIGAKRGTVGDARKQGEKPASKGKSK